MSESEQTPPPPERPHAGPPYQGHGPAPYQPPAPVPPPAPPGWAPYQQTAPYPLPEHAQPAAAPPPQHYMHAPPAAPGEAGKTVQTVGYVMAGASLVIPILGLAGLVLGIITATKPNRGGHGAAIICLSLVLGLLAAFFWSGVYSDGSY